jgi:hypothetical protein
MTTEYETTNGGWYQANPGARTRRRICGDCREALNECRCPRQATAQQREQVAR